MLGIQSETNGMPDDVASDLSGSYVGYRFILYIS
jgi:hypothetical protein